MKITVEIDGRKLVAKQPFPHAKHVRVASLTKCPRCKAEHEEGLSVHGTERTIEGHDTYASPARVECCGQILGVIRVKLSTIFGLEEDEAVLLNGRFRVY